MANSTTGWWTRSSPVTRIGSDGKWRTASPSLAIGFLPRTFVIRKRVHRGLSKSKSLLSLWVSPAVSTSSTTVRQKRALRSCDSLTGMCSLRPNDISNQLLTPVRFNVPNAESYASKVRMTDLDLEMAGTEEEKREVGDKKSSYVWKGLRLASKRQLSSFDRIDHGKGLEVLQPVASSIEATGDETAPTVPDDKGADPQEEHHSVEEQRPGSHNQVTTGPAA
jgi:hypothetical protein